MYHFNLSHYISFSPDEGQLTSRAESACETHFFFFKIYISKMWEEVGLNFLDKMLSTSLLYQIINYITQSLLHIAQYSTKHWLCSINNATTRRKKYNIAHLSFVEILLCPDCIRYQAMWKSSLTFPFVNFYETLQKFENLSEGLKRYRRTFSDCLPAHFYGVSDSLRPF